MKILYFYKFEIMEIFDYYGGWLFASLKQSIKINYLHYTPKNNPYESLYVIILEDFFEKISMKFAANNK